MFAIVADLLLAAEDTGGETGGSLLGFLLPLVIIGGLFYFLLILPQRRVRQKQETMRSRLSPGDDIRTVGGIYGTVVSVDDESVMLDIGAATHIRLATRAVAEILRDTEPESGTFGDDESDEA